MYLHIILAWSQCNTVTCSEETAAQPDAGNARRNRVCSYKVSSSITIKSNMCGIGEECFTHENWYGTCEPIVNSNYELILYPGYRCRGDEIEGVCSFGTKVCNIENRCEGHPAYGNCRRSGDCNFGHYCNEDGLCLQLNQGGEQCTTHDSCQKSYLCRYLVPTQTFGICTEVVSMDERELVLPEYNDLPVRQEDMEKLCRTGMVNRTTGRCASKLTSTKKGEECTTEVDCPTNDENVNSACKWGYTNDGKMYCDIEAGDDEWVSATEKFQDFYLTNLDCHTGEGFGQCGNAESKYKDYKWAEFKAKKYVELLNNPECLISTYKTNPYFWEYAQYWNAYTYSIHLILMVFLILSFIIE
jgi:hypothetical protein